MKMCYIVFMEKLIKKILNKENIFFEKIIKSTSGFTNIVYFVDNNYVVKIVAPNTKPEKINKEISFYKNIKLNCMPKYIASGNIDGVDYLILEKIKGDSLYNIWHTLDNQQRKNITLKIVNILKEIHKQSYSFLESKYVVNNLKDKMNKSFDLNISILKNKGFDVTYLKIFKQQYLNKVFEEQKIRLVYNDAHFDNFIYDGENVFIIDFDRVLCTSVDYELMIIGLMLEDPAKFASFENEKFVKKYDYINIWLDLQNFYPEMFNFTYIHERLYTYSFIYKLGQAFETNNNEKIKELLFNFKIFVDDLSIHM